MGTKKQATKRQRTKKTGLRLWNYAEASKALRFIKKVVDDLRPAFIARSHCQVALAKDPCNGNLKNDLRRAEELFEEYRRELEDVVGARVHDYAHGIVLFPAVLDIDGVDVQHLYLVWHDTRPGMDTFCDLKEYIASDKDLIACEKTIPAGWRK